MKKQAHLSLPAPIMAGVLVVWSGVSAALTIEFDYSYDTGGFFGDLGRRTVLEAAGSFFGRRITDRLDPIISSDSGTERFKPIIIRPDSGRSALLGYSSVPGDTLRIYVGGRELDEKELGRGGVGGSYVPAGATPEFRDTVDNRGQGITVNDASAGLWANDFGPWGGYITFDSDTSWYFDGDPSSVEPFAGRFDFYSVALHEIAHVLGFGISDSWKNQVSGSGFEGPQASGVYGGTVPLSEGGGHWMDGILSGIDAEGELEVAMGPYLAANQRKLMTDLDLAGLRDIGWQVTSVPLPAAFYLFAGSLFGLLGLGVRRGGRGPSGLAKQ